MGQSAIIHGFSAASGEKVTVQLLTGKTWTTTAASDGTWSIALDPQPASTGHTIKVSTSGGKSQTLSNVAFGDVFLCSGQSNMAFSVNLAFNATEEIADSVNYPNIRMFTAENVIGSTPQQDVSDFQNSKGAAGAPLGPYADSSWAASAPAAFAPAAGPYFTWPSAICYFYGRDVYKALGGKVPIGLIASSWGGQPIEPFMSPDALSDQTCGGTKAPPAPAPASASASVAVEGDDSNIWNGMIAPLAKMRYAGMLWYQGESNDNAAVKYACSFPALITDWRKKFDYTELPFYFVQLAPCDGSHWCGPFTGLRNAQLTGGMKLKRVGYAVAVDLGDHFGPAKSVHSRRKQEVGRRLALEALRMQYNQTTVSRGPQFASAAAVTTSAGAAAGLTISYVQDGSATKLHPYGTADCDVKGNCCGTSPFQVKSGSGAWVRANYTITGGGSEVTLTMPAGLTATDSTGVRYDWEQWPGCALYNGAGGPDNHTGIAGTPFCWTGSAPCPVVQE